MMTSYDMHIKLNNVTGDMSHITGTAALENMGLCCFTLRRNIWSFPVTLHVFGSSHFCLETLFTKKLVRYCYLYMGTLGLGEVTVWIRNGRVTTRMHGSCSL